MPEAVVYAGDRTLNKIEKFPIVERKQWSL